MTELTSIKHLNIDYLPILSNISIISRIECFLEDMNINPLPHIPVEFDLGYKRKTNIFHASTIGTSTGKSTCKKYAIGCARHCYYDYIGAIYKGAHEPRILRLFDTGSAIHAQLQAYLHTYTAQDDNSDTFESEVVVNPNTNSIADLYDISGHCDGIYQCTVNDVLVRFGIEIKTINDAGFSKTNGPHPEHVTQGIIYQKCLDLPLMVFVYYNKNDSCMAEFVKVFDEEHWCAIVSKLNLIRDAAISGREPNRESGWHCKSCKYKEVCGPPRTIKAAKATTIAALRTSSSRRRRDG